MHESKGAAPTARQSPCQAVGPECLTRGVESCSPSGGCYSYSCMSPLGLACPGTACQVLRIRQGHHDPTLHVGASGSVIPTHSRVSRPGSARCWFTPAFSTRASFIHGHMHRPGLHGNPWPRCRHPPRRHLAFRHTVCPSSLPAFALGATLAHQFYGSMSIISKSSRLARTDCKRRKGFKSGLALAKDSRTDSACS